MERLPHVHLQATPESCSRKEKGPHSAREATPGFLGLPGPVHSDVPRTLSKAAAASSCQNPKVTEWSSFTPLSLQLGASPTPPLRTDPPLQRTSFPGKG